MFAVQILAVVASVLTEQVGTQPTATAVADGYASLNGGTTGGNGGRTIGVNTLADLKKYASSKEKLVLKISEKISGGAAGDAVQVANDKTIIGVGANAFLEGVGLSMQGIKNVIVRNIKFTMSTVTKTYKNPDGRDQVQANDGDCISIKDSANIWVDHCEFFSKDPLKQTNQDLYDGLLDITKKSDFVTVSYNFFHDHHKVSLVGASDSDTDSRPRVTYHHNYFKHVKERLPSVRFAEGHVFNNLYEDVIHSAVNSRMGACLKIEQNLFKKAANPIATLNCRVAGKWDVAGNQASSCSGSQPKTSSCTVKIPYTYKPDTAQAVQTNVPKQAGVGKI